MRLPRKTEISKNPGFAVVGKMPSEHYRKNFGPGDSEVGGSGRNASSVNRLSFFLLDKV